MQARRRLVAVVAEAAVVDLAVPVVDLATPVELRRRRPVRRPLRLRRRLLLVHGTASRVQRDVVAAVAAGEPRARLLRLPVLRLRAVPPPRPLMRPLAAGVDAVK